MHILLGPMLFAMDVNPVNVMWGVGLTAILVPAIAPVALRPSAQNAMISALALVAWLVLGIIGTGIGC
jgi:hypothetical protein